MQCGLSVSHALRCRWLKLWGLAQWGWEIAEQALTLRGTEGSLDSNSRRWEHGRRWEREGASFFTPLYGPAFIQIFHGRRWEREGTPSAFCGLAAIQIFCVGQKFCCNRADSSSADIDRNKVCAAPAFAFVLFVFYSSEMV